MCVELCQWLIELERILILHLAPRWVRHSYLSKKLHTIPYTCGLSGIYLINMDDDLAISNMIRLAHVLHVISIVALYLIAF